MTKSVMIELGVIIKTFNAQQNTTCITSIRQLWYSPKRMSKEENLRAEHFR